MEINQVTSQIIDAAMKVHTALGPGLLESAYEACMAYELWTAPEFQRRTHEGWDHADRKWPVIVILAVARNIDARLAGG